MIIQEMATSLLAAQVEDITSVEGEAFAAYASNYVEASARPVCKGCHGG